MLWIGTSPHVAAAQRPLIHSQTIDAALDLTPRRPVLAHVRFCILNPGQCDVKADGRVPALSTREQFTEVVRVNLKVNRAISPRPDAGPDRWEIGVTQGDCEEYALQKRAELIARGWPSRDLRVAVVRMRDGVFHAVLLVQIGDTDFVLDNMTSRIVRWNQAPYKYLMVQDRINPRSWHTVVPRGRQALIS
ncbi:MAG: transglutaminase-like cysteine peptidase [Paracoccaceae bacterium]